MVVKTFRSRTPSGMGLVRKLNSPDIAVSYSYQNNFELSKVIQMWLFKWTCRSTVCKLKFEKLCFFLDYLRTLQINLKFAL